MIAMGVLGTSRRRGSSRAFAGMASLFSDGQKGAYYDFTNQTKLAVNADGTGGAPAVGSTARFAVDQSPNANHLRNTVNSVFVVADGIVTSGSNYGLFNMSGFGDWPPIDAPFELIVALEQQAFAGTDHRLLDLGGPCLLQGSIGGTIRAYSAGYGTQVAPGLGKEITIGLIFDPVASSITVDGSTPSVDRLSALPCAQFVLGSDLGGSNATQTRFKRLFVRSGLLNAVDRAGVAAWASTT